MNTYTADSFVSGLNVFLKEKQANLFADCVGQIQPSYRVLFFTVYSTMIATNY